MCNRINVAAHLAVTIASAMTVSAASAQNYVVVILQPVDRQFDGFDTVATAINSAGDIVGYFDDGDRHAAWWPSVNSVNGTGNYLEIVHLMGELEVPMVHLTTPHDINDSIFAVGLSNALGFAWEPIEMEEFVPPSGYDFFAPRAINSLGHVVGGAENADDDDAFYYSDNSWTNVGDAIDDELNGDYLSIGTALNDLRQMVGQVEVDSENRGFMYDLANDTFIDFGTLGGDFNIPADVNNWQVTVGESADSSGDPRPYALTYYQTYYEIDTFGLPNGRANGVNDVGEVVGSMWDNPFVAPPRAFLWRAGTTTDLTDLIQSNGYPQYTLTEATDINNAGQIIATGDTDQQSGVSFLLTPVAGNLDLVTPEPPRGGRTNKYTAVGATPEARQYFIVGFARGETRPAVCDVVINIENAILAGTARADVLGSSTFIGFAPQFLIGREVYHQLFEPATCRVSSVKAFVY